MHGWDFNPQMHWYTWLAAELAKKGQTVFVPEMPDTAEPEIEKWVNYLKSQVGDLDEETYFVGHSIGCQTIMRFLEKSDYNGKIGGCVFVAGWIKLANLEGEEVEAIAKPWLTTKIDFAKVKSMISRSVVYLSDNDPYDCVKENAKLFWECLGSTFIIEKGKGHFTEDDGVTELPEALKFFD